MTTVNTLTNTDIHPSRGEIAGKWLAGGGTAVGLLALVVGSAIQILTNNPRASEMVLNAQSMFNQILPIAVGLTYLGIGTGVTLLRQSETTS